MASDVFGIVGSTVAGAFRVDAVVAEGGFAVVYRAYHEGFRAPVALKCLKIPGHMSPDERDRFERQFGAEAELLFKLSAAIPTVVRPLHVEVVQAPDGSVMPFLALEWLEGETLEAVARRRRREGRPRFTVQELLPALTPVARALERAHHFNGPDGPISIIHRDLKPENLFVARVAGERVMKILDFGIAKAMSMATEVAGGASQGDGGGPFTPAYASPEQWMPQRFGPSGPWTDVWGLALTLVELLAGHPVIDGDSAAMMGTALDPVRRPTPRTAQVAVGDEVEAVFAKALAVDPRDRYSDVGEFWRALLQAEAADRPQGGSTPRLAGRSGTHSLPTSLTPGSVGTRAGMIPDLAVVARPSKRPQGDAVSQTAEREVGIALEIAQEPRLRDTAATEPVSAASDERAGGVESAPPRRDHASAPVAHAAPLTFEPPSPVERGVRRFATPVGMLLGGILITVIDGAYAASEGHVFTIGPLRPAVIAGALVIGAIGLGVARLVKSEP